MLTLHLFRHAKSDWAQPELDDYDRPLASRGRSAAPAMGARMARTGVAPTAALATIVFGAASWAEIAPGGGRLEAFSTPQDEAEYERSRG